ncbi:MAG: TolC family protein [Planctomycetota bacterium]
MNSNNLLKCSLLVLVVALVLVSGCSRAHHRESADAEVYNILTDKNQNPQWTVPRLDITPDPRSRFFDPTDPDNPPLPPDDPAAQHYMKVVYGMRGSKRWESFGQVEYLENPKWQRYLKGPEEATDRSLPVIKNLTLTDAVELSLIHSREYQTQLENLYLAALELTFERYRFDVRPLGFLGEPGTGLFYQNQPDFQSNMVGIGPTNIGASKLFSSGAQLVAEIANSTLWMFSGSNSTGTNTTFSYSLIQPLLAGAHREIVLEDLTQAERNVVYALRDFTRFRKQFFVNTITGGQVAGLQRFLRGFEFLADVGESPSVGFFPLLSRLQQLRNLETNVRTLEFLIEELRDSEASQLDIARLESSLAESRGDLIRDIRPFQDRVDQYKVQLGLPPDMEVDLDDSLLEPFEFIDPALIEVGDRIQVFGREIRKLQLPAKPERLQKFLTNLDELGRQVAGIVTLVESDFRRLDAILPERLSQLDQFGRRQLEDLIGQERTKFAEFCRKFEATAGRLQSLLNRPKDQPLPLARQKEFVKAIAAVRTELSLVIRCLSGTQVIVRAELIPLQPVSLYAKEAMARAMENRLDLMNRRASVMDARRKLEIAADALESNLDLVVEGDLRTPPFADNSSSTDFRNRESQYRVGLGFTTPLDRRAERNNYRAAQIAYQQARRAYMSAEDQTKLEVRQAVRTLQELSQNIVQRRRRVQFGTRELGLAQTQQDLAQRGLSLTTALRGLRRAQDELIEVWLDYETTRLNLYRDMGTMQINEDGFWLDPFYQKMLEKNNS